MIATHQRSACHLAMGSAGFQLALEKNLAKLDFDLEWKQVVNLGENDIKITPFFTAHFIPQIYFRDFSFLRVIDLGIATNFQTMF